VEMAEHEQSARRLALRILFADPHAPWQHGTSENTNCLLRQYLPKGTNLSSYTQRELNVIAYRLNTRPGKCLAFAAPLEASRSCGFIHSLHLELEAAVLKCLVCQQTDEVGLIGRMEIESQGLGYRPMRPVNQASMIVRQLSQQHKS